MAAKDIEPLIVIVGETASGKSDLAMYLARKFNGEIINADSWAVYKGFDIGTAKPSSADQKNIKHHLIDVADPTVGFSAAVFKRQVNKVTKDIYKRGKLPIISGGTGLYVYSIIYDYSFLPAGTERLRKKLNSMSLDDLQNEVKKLNYDTNGVDLKNKRRLIRLIENRGVRPKSKALRPNTLLLGLSIESQNLEKNIKLRIDRMIRSGLENEVRNLASIYSWSIEPMKGIGYREFKDYIEGTQSLKETKELIIIHSLQLAKKQRTWFKHNNSIHWVSNRSESIAIATTFLNKLNE